jgi:hypothetical protein
MYEYKGEGCNQSSISKKRILSAHDSMVEQSFMGALIADVVILSNIPKVLSYSIPEGVCPKVGCRVEAPVRKATRIGIVIDIHEGTQTFEGLKDSHQVRI